MPSGFQQDLNQLQPNFYRVAIDMSGYPTTGTEGGGITPNSVDSFPINNFPSTLLVSQRRSRGNMRFNNIVRRLSGLTDCQILDITITEANADAQATALAFTVKFERDQFIQTGGTAVDGSTAISSVVLKIRDEIVRGILDATSATMRVYDPSDLSDKQQTISVTAPVTAGNAWADVAVTLNSDTTLINS
jgi:hypothetical protein